MIREAVILMAGMGSRLGGPDRVTFKPFVPIGGRPLISYALNSFARAGVQKLHVVVGDRGDQLAAELAQLLPSEMSLNPIPNPEWRKQNGISVLCAAGHVKAPFFLAMGDHLFEYTILEKLIHSAERASLNLAVDRKIASIFDLDDAMKVQTASGRVTAIGKTLPEFDAIDTGIFVCPDELFIYLQRARKEGDCGLADGVRLMAEDAKVRAIDIGDAWWQDVDTPPMQERAEQESIRLRGTSSGAAAQ